jgi:V8-like Glu-specific endopeptidase
VQNYGNNPFGSGTNKDTIYHYTDNRVDTELMNDDPYRRAGHFAFVTALNESKRCTAALIKNSILVTAGHCLHKGGNTASGWIKSARFHPGYNSGNSPYGFANARYICVTSGWYNTGSIQKGYDVGVVVLHKRSGTTNQIGSYTGFFGFCHTSCLQKYWYLTQLGYPGNYDGGALMQEGQHLETNRDNTDYYHGSGMQGGSSGGPHIANMGTLSDSTTNKGNYTSRNAIFAVTSWGYISDVFKIQGASSLSGPSNGNDFKNMFNAACAVARSLHGTSACTNL